MNPFTQEQLRQRSFERSAWVLRHFWEEQQHETKREARVHTRLFDRLVPHNHIFIGKSVNGSGHIEHLVPCALLRDRAFEMYWNGKTEKEVSEMLGRFLRIAHITPAEARRLDHELGLKTKMPVGWDFVTGSVMARLEAGGIELELALLT